MSATRVKFEMGPTAVLEKVMLGLILMTGQLPPEDKRVAVERLTDERDRLVYTAMLTLERAEAQITYVDVANELLQLGVLSKAGGLSYLVCLGHLAEVWMLGGKPGVKKSRKAVGK